MELFKLIQKAFVRLRTAAMNPFRRVIRRVQQVFNVNLITAKLITPINKKIRSILNFKPKARDDYVTVGIFWISKKLIYFFILAACAGVFLYFSWFAKPVDDMVSANNLITTTYYDYDDLKLAEYTGRANIRATNGAVVYTGDIAAGRCTGAGTLWNQDGALVYEGTFENNDFAGNGTLYYPNKKVKYEGEFANNAYSGSGISYYQDGAMEYEGEFENGMFSGAGTFYAEDGAMVYAGNFENGSFSGAGITYYENGVKKYEGEFYLGKAQGIGTSYSVTGKKLFTGQFNRDQIQYESLLNASMEDVLSMCNEAPKIYYSKDATCFLFEGLGIALETNCIVEMKKDAADTSSGNGWYLPGEEQDSELLQETQDGTVAVDFPDQQMNTEGSVSAKESKDDAKAESGEAGGRESVELPAISTAGKYNAYYYLESDEWKKEADLDYSQIQVTGLVVMNPEFASGFLEDEVCTYSNGEADLLECVAIDQLRLKKPTLFSNIKFTQTAKTKKYIQITGIDLAAAVYTETYEVDNVRYRLCYEKDHYEQRQFITLEAY